MRTIFFILPLMGLMSAGSAYAQTPVIEEISKNSLNVIRHVSRVNEPALSLASAQKIKRAVLANTLLDDGELKMLEYLQSGQGFTIKLSTGETTFDKPVSDEAKAFLQTIKSVTYDDPVQEMWARGTQADLQKVIEVYNGSSEGKKQIESILGDELNAAWATPGEYSRREKAFKSVMARWSSKLYKLSGSDYAALKSILYDTAYATDKAGRATTDGNLPDHHYSFLKP